MKPLFTSLLLLAVVAISCVKQKPDVPPDMSHYDPMLKVTHTIASLKALNGNYDWKSGGDTSLINEDVIISGIVTADDRSGNFYKQIVIEDSSAAIMVKIDGYNLFNDYPVGRKIYIKCKGLYLGYDSGLPVLGSMPDAQLSVTGIPANTVEKFIVKADVGHVVAPMQFSLAEVAAYDPNLANRIITITDVQFKESDNTYAQPNTATNRTLMSCTKDSIAVRTSNYATFATAHIPANKGSVTAIYTVYISSTSGRSTPQLLIRDTTDVQLTEVPCDLGLPVASNTPILSIDSIRKMYHGTDVKLGAYRITGIVISDAKSKNVATGNIVLQHGGKGITVYYGATPPVDLGDSIIIDVSGNTLTSYGGALEIKATSGKTIRVASGKTVVPVTLSIQQLLTDFSNYESVLVKIPNASISSGGTYSGNKQLNDGTGTITLYTASGASFAGQNVPTGSKTFQGIVTPYTGGVKELKMRNPAIDVY